MHMSLLARRFGEKNGSAVTDLLVSEFGPVRIAARGSWAVGEFQRLSTTLMGHGEARKVWPKMTHFVHTSMQTFESKGCSDMLWDPCARENHWAQAFTAGKIIRLNYDSPRLYAMMTFTNECRKTHTCCTVSPTKRGRRSGPMVIEDRSRQSGPWCSNSVEKKF